MMVRPTKWHETWLVSDRSGVTLRKSIAQWSARHGPMDESACDCDPDIFDDDKKRA